MQVAEMTGERATFIWREMPLARCYQFQVEWFAKRGYHCDPINSNVSALRRIVQ